jgi:serine/threonine protein kinase
MDVIATAPVLTFHFDFVEQIGKGGNSTVWSVRTKDGRLFACKIPDKGGEDMIIKESQIMSGISKYPFLTLYGIYSHNGIPVSVYELFEGQELISLIEYIRENPASKLTEQQILQVAKSHLCLDR